VDHFEVFSEHATAFLPWPWLVESVPGGFVLFNSSILSPTALQMKNSLMKVPES
jgi:hypothetical protein